MYPTPKFFLRNLNTWVHSHPTSSVPRNAGAHDTSPGGSVDLGRDDCISRGLLARVRVPARLMLVLKKTASIYGIGGGNDYTVLDGPRVIGRIFLSPAAPPDRNWMWTIIAREYPPSIHNRGYSATREQAMADLNAQWLRPSQ